MGAWRLTAPGRGCVPIAIPKKTNTCLLAVFYIKVAISPCHMPEKLGRSQGMRLHTMPLKIWKVTWLWTSSNRENSSVSSARDHREEWDKRCTIWYVIASLKKGGVSSDGRAGLTGEWWASVYCLSHHWADESCSAPFSLLGGPRVTTLISNASIFDISKIIAKFLFCSIPDHSRFSSIPTLV